MRFITQLSGLALCIAILASCSVNRQIRKAADTLVLRDSSLLNAHLGIAIYDISSGKYLYDHQGDKYFIPGSNTKLFTCYTALKYLGDSLTGLQYLETDTAVILRFTADPTLLHPDFKQHPVLDFLKGQHKKLYTDSAAYWKDEALGMGWAWDDYNDDYMTEKNPLPVYGNTVRFTIGTMNFTSPSVATILWKARPAFFNTFADTALWLPTGNRSPEKIDTAKTHAALKRFSLRRGRDNNHFSIVRGGAAYSPADIPFCTSVNETSINILAEDFNLHISTQSPSSATPSNGIFRSIKSQPLDSVLKNMMYRSDNFYAEQLLLMTACQRLGYMKTSAITDTLLKTDLAGLPQRPKWVDGSGLSRYNLFTPQDFITILTKMHHEFGLNRLKKIMATGGTGTITNYYQSLKERIFVKTGTLSNNCALSGFLLTDKGKWLIFSILANDYPGGATAVRRAVERFLLKLTKIL